MATGLSSTGRQSADLAKYINHAQQCDQRHSDDCRDEIELFCQSMHVQNGVRMFHLISGGIQHFLLLIL